MKQSTERLKAHPEFVQLLHRLVKAQLETMPSPPLHLSSEVAFAGVEPDPDDEELEFGDPVGQLGALKWTMYVACRCNVRLTSQQEADLTYLLPARCHGFVTIEIRDASASKSREQLDLSDFEITVDLLTVSTASP